MASSLTPALINATCNCLAVRRAARNVARKYDEAFKPFAISNGQFSMLVVIAGLESVGIQAIGDVLGMDRTTVTAALKPLQRRGLVSVAVADNDQRGRAVRLTKAGTDLLDQAIPLWAAVQNDVSQHLGGEDEVQTFRRQLHGII